MKVLFVTMTPLETNTSVTKSNIGLLTGLKKIDADVDIVMPSISENLSYYDNYFDLVGFNVIRINNVDFASKIVTVSSSSHGIKKSVISLMRNCYYKFKILDRGTRLLQYVESIPVYNTHYDLVISTSDPKSSHLFVREMISHGLKYSKWIQHWGDPLTSDISYSGIYPEFVRRKIEERIIQNADRIVYVSPFTLNVQKTQFKDHCEKMCFVPLACDMDESLENCSNSANTNLRIKLSYLGDYSSSIRNIVPLYNVCKKNKNIELTIAGNTDLSLEEADNIKIYERLPQDKTSEIEKASDILVSIGNLKGNQIPGKIYYAAASGKTILVTVDGQFKEEMKEYLESFDRYVCCNNDEDSIEDALHKILGEDTKDIIKHKQSQIPKSLLPENVAREIVRGII